MIYKRRKNEIVDETGKQIAIVLATNCSMKMARMMAAYCVQQLNVEEARKKRIEAVATNSPSPAR